MALLTNLVSYYKLENTTDSAGANTLTNNNSVTFTAGKINNGANFGTSNTNKSLTATTNMGITGGAITINFWAKMLTEIGSSIQVFTVCGDAGTNVNYYCWYDFNGGTRQISVNRQKQNTSNNIISNTGALGTTNLNMFTLTYDSTNLIGYFNATAFGSPLATSGNGASGGATGFSIGGDHFNGDTLMNSCMVDECGVWSRALSSTEVTQLYNSGNGITYPFSTVYTMAITPASYMVTMQNVLFPKIYIMAIQAAHYVVTLKPFTSVWSFLTNWTKSNKSSDTWTTKNKS
jgi:hypothetical protein